MKPIALSVLLLMLLSLATSPLLFGQEGPDRGYIVKTGQQAPDFTVTLDDGSSWTLSEQRGKVVMLQFTASWCPVCRKEMPYIEKEIYRVFDKNEFTLIGIDRDEPQEKVLAFKKRTGITYPLALDPGSEVFKRFAHEKAGVTRNIIIDREGKIIYLTRLFKRKEFDQMVEAIKKAVTSNP
ncbi:MAG: redoxin [Bacteroidetes bacterium]|nr:MAG: redoxin [Bacteroidota bacterium]PIE88140.1 MAG: redoxin [Bacteroidota bacterium]